MLLVKVGQLVKVIMVISLDLELKIDFILKVVKLHLLEEFLKGVWVQVNLIICKKKSTVQIVNLDVIDKLELDTINVDTLIEFGIVKKASCPVKILGYGEVKKAISITADMFSETAIKKIEAAGGEVIYDK